VDAMTEKQFDLPVGTSELVLTKAAFLDLIRSKFKQRLEDLQVEENSEGAFEVRLFFNQPTTETPA
jgi:hypothetical protein